MFRGALEGIRVVDFTRIFAGPLASQILGDLGADVVKVERVDSGDEVRLYGVETPKDVSPGFLAFNRNKRSVTIDLDTENGRLLARRVIEGADVVIENFRAGVMESWGLGYESLKVENPRLIYCSISGFGQKGPLARKAANDVIVQAYSGLMSIMGHPGDDPVRCPAAVADLPTGIYAATGVITALFYRERTGRGQRVELSLLECLVSLMAHLFADYYVRGELPVKLGSAVQLGLPNQAFPTSDGWVVVAAVSDQMWKRLCAALGVPDLSTDSRFETLARRRENAGVLIETLTAVTTSFDTSTCVSRLEAHGVSCSPIRTFAEVAEDELLRTLGIVEVVSTAAGDKTIIGSPLHLSETPTSIRRAPPRLGEHNAEVFEEIAFRGRSAPPCSK